MSWTFGNVGGGAALGTGGTQAGPDLEDISTDSFGFMTIAGETRVQLLSQAWPSDRLPPPTASLLSVASNKGLIAAAAPDALIIATTESVRQAYKSDIPPENGVKPIQATIKLPIPRVSQVSFSSDGSCLVIAAEEGGGLAVYDVQAVQQGGQQQSAFQLATNGIPIRTLAANPASEYSHLFAVVLAGGQLLIADLKERKLVSGSTGTYFKEGVSCVSWSARGKQMVAGLADGTAAQFDHQGNQKASIPAPSQLQGQTPMTGISWLANDDFLTIHTPLTGNSESAYHLIHREKTSGSFTSSKFVGDPAPAFGLRHPAHHFISRLRQFPPGLDDVLIISSSASTDIGVITKSANALSQDVSADKIVNVYTTTAMANDARRATMPMSSDGMGDTSPIGQALDLSSNELIPRPLPSEDLEQTAYPVPALMILDNEGKLSTWWVMYTESIRQGTVYPGLVSASGQSTSTPAGNIQQVPAQTTITPKQATPAFGSASFGQSSQPAFGSTGGSAFGTGSTLGSRPSPWTATSSTAQASPAFGKPAFGSASVLGSTAAPAFGSAGGIGNKSSPWASSNATSQSPAPAFEQASALGAPTANASGFAKFGQMTGPVFGSSASQAAQVKPSPFGGVGSDKPAASPFAAVGGDKSTPSLFSGFASNKSSSLPFGNAGDKPAASPFASFGSNAPNKPSPFATPSQTASTEVSSQPSFGSTTNQPSAGSFGQPSSGFSFGRPSASPSNAVSREETMVDEDTSPKPAMPEQKLSGLGGFKLVSGFKGDGSAKDDLPRTGNAGTSVFGSSFDNMLGDVGKQPSTPERTADTAANSSLPLSPPKTQKTPSTAAKPTAAASPVEEAPLPPDFTKPAKTAAKDNFDDVPLPPEPLSEIKQEEPEDAPLPPDFAAVPSKSVEVKSVQVNELPPIAGSPPVDIAGGNSSDLSPAASDDSEEGGEGEDKEVDSEDVVEEDEDETDEVGEEDWEDETGEEESGEELETPQVTQQNIEKASTTPFGSRLAFPSTQQSDETQKQSQQSSTTPAGLPKGPIFAPPQKESPRSPSPVRSISTPAPRPITKQVPNPTFTLQPRPTPLTSIAPSESVRSFKQPQQLQKPQQPEARDLSDDEDARIKSLLASAVEPSKQLDPFIAHQDYVGNSDKSGLGGQIEIVFRDINSMIDTLGLNARSLQAFVEGHENLRKQGDRNINDLEDEDWCLVEVEDLIKVEDQIERDITSSQLSHVDSTLADLTGLLTETLRLRTRAAEIRRQLTLHSDPEKRAAQRSAPLDTEAEMQQSLLRQALNKVQKLLQEAEEQISVFRAELASAASNSSDGPAPTVEAVTNTIMKMTAMIEQKSGDVDVLEAQIRRLPQGLAGLSLEDDEQDALRSSVSSLRSSRRSLPVSRTMPSLSTPAGIGRQNRRSVMGGPERLGMSGMLGSRFRTPPKDLRRSTTMNGSPDASLRMSMISVGGSERRRMADVTDEEVRAYQERASHRRKILDALRETVEKKGTRIVRAT